MNKVYEQCEDCLCEVNMMDIIVKETVDDNWIYCPKYVERHKFLEQESKRLCKLWPNLWGIDMIAYGKEVDKVENDF